MIVAPEADPDRPWVIGKTPTKDSPIPTYPSKSSDLTPKHREIVLRLSGTLAESAALICESPPFGGALVQYVGGDKRKLQSSCRPFRFGQVQNAPLSAEKAYAQIRQALAAVVGEGN